MLVVLHNDGKMEMQGEMHIYCFCLECLQRDKFSCSDVARAGGNDNVMRRNGVCLEVSSKRVGTKMRPLPGFSCHQIRFTCALRPKSHSPEHTSTLVEILCIFIIPLNNGSLLIHRRKGFLVPINSMENSLRASFICT